MTLEQNGFLRHGHFSDFLDFFGDRMANFGLIDFKLGLYIKINVNGGKTDLKFISQKVWPKWTSIAQNRSDATFGKNIKWI